MPPSPPRSLLLLYAGAVLALHLNLGRYFMEQQGDDGFIFFRYALHLAEGFGPVWNPAEPPVEGFSSPLWLALLGLGVSSGAEAALVARWLGLLSGITAVLGSAVLARKLGATPLYAALAAGGLSATAGLHYWAPAGLETALYAALFTWGLASLVRPGRAWAFWAGLLGVCRPEGPALSLLWVALAWQRGARRPSLAAVALGPALAWQIFRWTWYGAWLPNTYYAKAAGTQPEQFLAGLRYLEGVPLLLLLVLVGQAMRLLPRRGLPVSLALGGLLLIVAGGGGDWMWHGRLALPLLGGLWALLASASGPWLRPALALALAGLPLLGPRWVSSDQLLASLRGERLPAVEHQEGTLLPASRSLAQTLSELSSPGQLLAVNHAGIIPYLLPQLSCLDMAGLSDAWIARREGAMHQKFDPDYVLERSPHWIVFNSRTRPGTDDRWLHSDYWRGETVLAEHPEFSARYRPYPQAWARQAHGGAPSYLLLYYRSDLTPSPPRQP